MYSDGIHKLDGEHKYFAQPNSQVKIYHVRIAGRIVRHLLQLRALGQLKVARSIPFHLIIGVRHSSNRLCSSDGIVAYSSSYLDGAESELDVQTVHTVTHSPKTEEEVLRILKLDLESRNRGL